MDILSQSHQETQKPISPGEVGEGKLLIQFIFNYRGNLCVWNGIGDAREFAIGVDEETKIPMRSKLIWAIVAACTSIISAAYNLSPAPIEQDPELATQFINPDGTPVYREQPSGD